MKASDSNLPAHPAGAGYRDSAPDALFGAVLAMEAVLGLLVAQGAGHGAGSIAGLRRKVEAALDQAQGSTKYGTGGRAIADGARDSLDAIFAAAAPPVDLETSAPAVNAP